MKPNVEKMLVTLKRTEWFREIQDKWSLDGNISQIFHKYDRTPKIGVKDGEFSDLQLLKYNHVQVLNLAIEKMDHVLRSQPESMTLEAFNSTIELIGREGFDALLAYEIIKTHLPEFKLSQSKRFRQPR